MIILFGETSGLGEVVFDEDDHGAAADFAVVVEFGGLFVGVRERDVEGLEAGGAGDLAEVHGRVLEY
jgi:hypothetical protein